MEDKVFTVDELISFLTRLKGCGDFKIKIGERPLFTDEYTVRPQEKEINFHGSLYHEDIMHTTIELKKDVEKSIEKFYRNTRGI